MVKRYLLAGKGEHRLALAAWPDGPEFREKQIGMVILGIIAALGIVITLLLW
jgi:hypothetical protein